MAGPTGSQKLVVLLCKFKDTAQIEPHPPAFYEDMLRRGSGGLNDYWVDASHQQINLDGSQVFGWRTLAQNRSDYIASHTDRWSKIQGAIDAFPELLVVQHAGVLAIFNADVNDSGRSGPGVLVNVNDDNPCLMAHETGHMFGLGHSFDQSDRKLHSWSAPGEYYDNHDIMSAMNVFHYQHPQFGPTGPLLSAPFLDLMGWLDPSRIWTPAHSGSTIETLELVSLGHTQVPGYLAARINSLYVEFRTNDGWDQGLPHPTVLIHELTGKTILAMTTESASGAVTGKGRWDHEWLPGQTFGAKSPVLMDIEGGTQISVESFDLQAGKAVVTIRHQVARPVSKQGQILGGVAVGGDGILILPNGQVYKVPPHSPVIRAMLAVTAFAVRVKEGLALERN